MQKDKQTQSDRFEESARKAETDDDPEAFDRLFGRLVPPIVPTSKEVIMVDDRIPERAISKEALRLLAQAPGGFMTTTDLIAALERQFEPTGFDAEILDGRADTRFSQKVRNLVSHRNAGTGLEVNDLATYDDVRRGWTITDKGRAHE